MNNKAVAIAKDVLAQIKLQQYVPNSGAYFYDIEDPDNPFTIAEDVLDKKCKVCALGACIVSAARLFNQDTYEAKPMFSSINEKLNGYFDHKDLLLIEYTFEEGMYGALADYGNHEWEKYYSTFDKVTRNAAILYGRSYHYSNERLVAIMRNIIRNKGSFIVPRKFIRQAKKEIELDD